MKLNFICLLLNNGMISEVKYHFHRFSPYYYYYYYYAVFNAPYVCQSMTKSQARCRRICDVEKQDLGVGNSHVAHNNMHAAAL